MPRDDSAPLKDRGMRKGMVVEHGEMPSRQC